MNRNRIAVLVVALLCVGALAAAAATVDAPRASDAGTGSGSGDSAGDGPASGVQTPMETQETDGLVPSWFRVVALAVFGVALLITLAVVVRTLDLRTATRVAVVVLVIGLVGLALMWAIGPFDTSLGSTTQSGQPDYANNDTGGSGEGGRQTDPANRQFDVPVALLAAFGLVAVVLVGAIARFSDSEESVPAPVAGDGTTGSESEGVKAVGEAAGRAADRIDDRDGDVENAVYRAWREMTTALDVDAPATTTPEEFAEAAVDAGMDDEDVRELTWLFEEVRYGDAAVTDERERRARDALRRIESAYADVESDAVREEMSDE